MKNEYFLNFPLLVALVISGCLEYVFTVRFFRILTEWIPTANIGYLFVGILSFALAVVSIAEIGLLLSLLSRDVREAFAHRE